MKYLIYDKDGALYDVLFLEHYDNDMDRLENAVRSYTRAGYTAHKEEE